MPKASKLSCSIMSRGPCTILTAPRTATGSSASAALIITCSVCCVQDVIRHAEAIEEGPVRVCGLRLYHLVHQVGQVWRLQLRHKVPGAAVEPLLRLCLFQHKDHPAASQESSRMQCHAVSNGVALLSMLSCCGMSILMSAVPAKPCHPGYTSTSSQATGRQPIQLHSICLLVKAGPAWSHLAMANANLGGIKEGQQ